MTSYAIDIRNLGKSFAATSSRGRMQVLVDINIQIPVGQFCTIVGPSGCGKSTILNAISGLTECSEGEIHFMGSETLGQSEDLAYMFQKDTLLPWYTVRENIVLPMKIRRLAADEQIERLRSLLKLVGLTEFGDHYPRELSGGMRKRVQMARMLAQDPKVFLMDEPFGALDAQTKLLMQEEFARIWENRRQTVVFVTHDLQEAIGLGDRVILISARPGRIKGDWEVPIPRPRRMGDIITDRKFAEIYQKIWTALREEVLAG